MPEPGLTAAERAEATLAAVAVAIAIIGVTLLPLTTPPVVRALVIAVDAEQRTGLGLEATLEAAEAVRHFVTDPEAPSLPEVLAGEPAFDESAVSHLIDVRDVMIPARTLALLLAGAVLVWAALRGRSARGRGVIGASLRGAGLLLLGGAGLVVAAGLTDFDALFSRFHSLFFEPATWVFPDSALLIRVFPLPFWVTAGAIWGGFVLVSGTLLFISGRRLRFTREEYGV